MPRVFYNDKLDDCPDEQLNVRVPVPLKRKVDELCADALDADRTLKAVSAKEMVAAAVYAIARRSELDPAELVKTYRDAMAHHLMPAREGGQEFYEYDEPRRGRRPRSGG
jgi:hypothetical protein